MPIDTGTATSYIDLLNQLRLFSTGTSAATAVVSAGGTGYTVGDVLTLTGGTFSKAAQLRVTTVAAGVVTGVVIHRHGVAYTVNPSNPVSSTGGTGTGATFTVTFASVGWSTKRESKEAVSATVSAGGTGHAVNDILTLVGGTAPVLAAQFKVTAISAGAVTTVVRWSRGNYPETPANPASTTSSGAGTGCTLTVIYQVVLLDSDQDVSTAAIVSGGTGYTVADILTVTGGTFTTAAQLRVLTISAGVITTVAVHTKGEYSINPTNPVSVTGGTGTGATFNLTFVGVHPDNNKELILEGVGSGADQVFVGMRTEQHDPSGSRYWNLAGFTGYQAASTFDTQPSRSTVGALFTNSLASQTYWFFANGRRIIVIARIGSSYLSCHLGWINPFATAIQYPYPMAIIGCSSTSIRLPSETGISLSGIVDPIGHTSSAVGPAFIRDPGGSWKIIKNSEEIGGGARNYTSDLNLFPAGSVDNGGAGFNPQDFSGGAYTTRTFVPVTGSPGTVTIRHAQIPDSPNHRSILFPTMIVERTPVQQAYGELADVYWVSTLGNVTNLVAEDLIVSGTDRYIVFQQANRSDLHAHFAVKEG